MIVSFFSSAKNIQPLSLATILFTFSLLPFSAFANGGDQRIVEGRYFINLSRAPFTPRAGTKTALLVSIADVQTGAPIREPLTANVYIYKQGDAPEGLPPLFEKKNIVVERGVFELPYTFEKPGLHEIFFDFSFASDPQKVYEPPDFLIDVQEPKTEARTGWMPFLLLGVSALFGLLVG